MKVLKKKRVKHIDPCALNPTRCGMVCHAMCYSGFNEKPRKKLFNEHFKSFDVNFCSATAAIAAILFCP